MPPPAKGLQIKGLKGFTLAEVLITLGIIGIVAALTMPVLIANYQNTALQSQFKRAYSNIYNAIRLIEAKDGVLPQCYYHNNVSTKFVECEDFYEKLTKQMNVIKTCKGNAYEDNCIPKYQGVDTIKEYEDDDALNGCSGYRQNNILNRNWAFVFNDGTILFTYDEIPGDWAGCFALDVNGKKGPNKWGHDIFSFELNEVKPGIIRLEACCSLVEKGGKKPEEMLSGLNK